MYKKCIKLFVMMFLLVGIFQPAKSEAASVTYTISPSSKPYNKKVMKYNSYNTHTKQYYLLITYLQQLEKKGGGKLVLKKGTYTISNVLYVPSNVTIVLQDGVNIVKGTKTGTKSFSASKSIFQLIKPSKGSKKGVYGGYNGEKNISIIGEGNAVIDLKYMQDSIAIIAGHNQNIVIDNITFQNMYSGHFIEMDATKNAKITNNEFKYSKTSSRKNKEAINIDTPDKSTEGWSSAWSKYDKTPNQDIQIENNYFYKLERAIGTHKFSGGKYHENVQIRNNTIKIMKQDPIRVMNWTNTVIENNVIEDVADGTGGYRAVLVSGAKNPIIQNNTFKKVSRPVQFMVWKNSGAGEGYGIIYNTLYENNKQVLATNKMEDVEEMFARVNTKYNVYSGPSTYKIEMVQQ